MLCSRLCSGSAALLLTVSLTVIAVFAIPVQIPSSNTSEIQYLVRKTFKMDFYFGDNCLLGSPGAPQISGELGVCYTVTDNFAESVASYRVDCFPNGTYQPYMKFLHKDCVDLIPMHYKDEVDGKACWWVEDDLFVSRYNLSIAITDPGCVPGTESSPLVSPTPTAFPQPTQGPNSTLYLGQETQGESCFPGDSTVVLKSGLVIQMRDLQIGDQIMTGNHDFSTVFFFSHRIHGGIFDFTHIETIHPNYSITVSNNHYLIIRDKLVQVKYIKVGDHIQTGDGVLLQVTRISQISAAGLYAPHTLSDKLLVDGIQVSVYTASVHPTLARLLLAPLKMFYNIFKLPPLETILDSGNDVLRSWMPRGPSVY